IKKIEFDGKLPQPKSRVLFKTLILFEDLPDEIYTLHQIAQYRALDTEIKRVANTMEDLKDKICDRFADDYPKELGELYEEVYGDSETREKNKKLRPLLVEKQLKALFWLFGENYDKVEVNFARKNIPRIIKVFSRNNRRVAIIQVNENWDKYRGGLFQRRWMEQIQRTTLKICAFTPRDRRYNYACPNRELYLPNEYEEKGEIWVGDDLFEKITLDELKVLSKRMHYMDENERERSWKLLTADEYNQQKAALRVELMSARRKYEEQEAKNKLIKSIQEQFGKGEVTRHGISFSKKRVSYEGTALTGSKLGEYLVNNSVLLQERPSFNDIYEGYVDFILKLEPVHNYNYDITKIIYHFEGKENITIGGIKATIEVIKNNMFINGRRICKDDVATIVKSAINFNSQKSYDEAVLNASRVNLKLRKALQEGGLSFELKIDKTDDNSLMKEKNQTCMLLSVPISRRKGKNYVKINSKEYSVKDTNALFDLSRQIDSSRIGYSGGGYLQRTIRLIYKAIAGITPKEIGDLIRNGRKEYKKLMLRQKKEARARTKKSLEFLAHAVKLTKAEKVHKGYFVKGLSGTTYFIGKDLEVWTIKNGKQSKYLCIIDSGSRDDDEAGKNDCIAKRLLMLSKDKVIAKEVYYEGDRMDKHWLEIM
ncbi:MAG: hypothetical protein AABX74_00725, partial [Nanoarchaeota archaeon]